MKHTVDGSWTLKDSKQILQESSKESSSKAEEEDGAEKGGGVEDDDDGEEKEVKVAMVRVRWELRKWCVNKKKEKGERRKEKEKGKSDSDVWWDQCVTFLFIVLTKKERITWFCLNCSR